MKASFDLNTFLLYNFIFLITTIFMVVANKKKIIIGFSNLKKDKPKNINSMIIYLIATIPLILSLALRDESVGGDLSNYINTYQRLKNAQLNIEFLINNITNQEPIYLLINIVLGILSNWNNRVLIIFYSIAPWFFILKAIYREKNNLNVSISYMVAVCFFYFKSFSMLRQSLAMAIILYAYTFIRDKDFKKYFYLALLAVGVHYTAIIALPFYFFSYNNKWGKVKRLIILIGIILLFSFGPMVIEIIVGFMGNKYSHFASGFRELGIGNFAVKLPTTATVLFFYNKIIKNDKGMKPYLLIFLLNILIIQFKYLNPLFERFVYYSEMSLIFIVPTIFDLIKKKIGLLLTTYTFTLLLILYFNYTLYFYTFINNYYVMPYKIFK